MAGIKTTDLPCEERSKQYGECIFNGYITKVSCTATKVTKDEVYRNLKYRCERSHPNFKKCNPYSTIDRALKTNIVKEWDKRCGKNVKKEKVL